MNLRDKVNHFAARPGVYLMKDAQGRVIYVGKAKNLRVRVRNYFREGGDGRPKIGFLMNKVEDIDFIVADNEKEALLLENTLIKRFKPRYNVSLRDDKTYLSLRIDPTERFPKLSVVRKVKRDGALYFGPYSSGGKLRETVKLLQKAFPLRRCSDQEFGKRDRPCLYHQTGACSAPCFGLISEEAYGKLVRQAILFLKGKGAGILDDLNLSMNEAAENMNYEDAARLRDAITAVKQTLEKQKVATHDNRDIDAIAIYREGSEAQAAALIIRSGVLIDRRSYYLSDLHSEDSEAADEFLQQYYRGQRLVPSQILISATFGEEEKNALEEWLSEKKGKKVKILSPKRGEKAELLAMAQDNAKELLAERRKTKVGYDAALAEIEKKLKLPSRPSRIECFDISNIQGRHAVASMAVFVDGFPQKDAYRKFKIKSVEGQDDFAMLYEALTRRFKKKDQGWPLPELLMVDGGRGQVAAAAKALSDAGMDEIPLAGIAKARVVAGDEIGVEHSSDRIFIRGRTNPILFSKNSSALFLLCRIRDEAHRFAIEFHRKQRGRAVSASALDEIRGVGKSRRAALLKRFGSLKRIKAATPAELAQTPGISLELAETIIAKLLEPVRE